MTHTHAGRAVFLSTFPPLTQAARAAVALGRSACPEGTAVDLWRGLITMSETTSAFRSLPA